MMPITTDNSIIVNPRCRLSFGRAVVEFASVFFTLTPRTAEHCAVKTLIGQDSACNRPGCCVCKPMNYKELNGTTKIARGRLENRGVEM